MEKQRGEVARPVRGKVIDVGIWALVQWAFRLEGASLDFDETGPHVRVGNEWVLLEQARLGCRPDGGGSSASHPDADLVASAVTVLPEVYGGRRMALYMAELARTGSMPDWRPDACPRCEPVGWRRHKTGFYAEREFWRGTGQWPATWIPDKYGFACPIRFYDTAAEIGRARRSYLQWWSALNEVRHCLSVDSPLSAFRVTAEMPPVRPWGKKGLT
ncbi:hypothetical protein [Maritimibacter alexandrii]|uniref:hypothetical protein n=1 Tax=Maritimibacter alexandrii TaxID=2570355 RepID=UPI001108718A|nr:hypothetical protein [Maritimibacter alexandrii]